MAEARVIDYALGGAVFDIADIARNFVFHVDAAGRSVAESADKLTAARHLGEFTDFVDARVPEALGPNGDILSITIDDGLRDDAFAIGSDVSLGRAHASFERDVVDMPVIVGHELGHALRLQRSNAFAEELHADFVGLAYARSLDRSGSGALWDPATAWRIGGLGPDRSRDLRQPAYAGMSQLVAAGPKVDEHLTAGPVGAAVARASDAIGIDAMDRITVEAALRDVPARDAALGQRLAAIPRDAADAHAQRITMSLRETALATIDAARRVGPTGADDTLLEAYARQGLDLGPRA